MNLAGAVITFIGAYGLGCCCFGYGLVRWKTGKDVRDSGSGGVGATNVGRVLGRSGFALTFLADAAKGAVVVFFVRALDMPAWVLAVSLIAVVLGHLYPLPLRFRGGKGVATLIGIALVCDWRVAVWLLAPFLLVWLLTRRYQVGGLAAIALSPLAVWLLDRSPLTTVTFLVLTLLVLNAHRSRPSQRQAKAE